MKRIGAFILAFILSALSIFIYFPSFSFAADDVTVIPLVEGHFGLSEADAQSKVSAHKDIYFDNNTRAFAYTPGTSYNWTLCDSNGAVTSTHLSDKQVVALLCSSNRMDHNRTLISSFISNNNIFRGFMSGVGSIFTGDSDNGTKLLDIVTGNYNYLDSLNYDEDSQTITMSNDNGSVDKLREEIKKYYYKSNGMFYVTKSGKPTDILKTSWYDDLNLYQEDFNLVSNYDYAIGGNEKAFYFNQSDFAYFYIYSNGSTLANYADLRLQFVNTDLKAIDLPSITGSLNCTDNIDTDDYTCDFSDFYFRLSRWFSSNQRGDRNQLLLNDIISKGYTAPDSWDNPTFLTVFWKNNNLNGDSSYNYLDSSGFYSKGDKTLVGFISYEKLFNYVHGNSSSYLSSVINKTGEDISFSIKDMNENLGDKMDKLIDSINSGKSNMTQDELQNAIDKGLEDLNKNTEEIKDNTAEMNNKLDELIAAVNQGNDTLLEILGVTEYIAYSTTKDDGTAYTLDDLFFSFGSIYDALGNAILYGVNTLDADSASASYSSSAYSLSSAALLSDDDSGNSGSGGSVGNSGSGNSGSGGHIDFEYRNGLFGHFPFSVPYQLYEWLQVLKATPKCPEFTYNYGFLIGHKDEDAYSITFDLSAYQDWADNCKSFLRLSFTLLFAVGVFNKLKGVM